MKTFHNLCEDNYERIYKYVWCMLDNKSHAEDITQEVFLIAYKKGEAFLLHDKPEAFLYRTAKNLVYEHIRKTKRENAVEIEESLNEVTESDVYDYICREKDKEIREEEHLENILSHLSKERYLLYQEYYIKHKSMKKIAQEHNSSEVAIRMKYVRLRREIIKIVKKLNIGAI